VLELVSNAPGKRHRRSHVGFATRIDWQRQNAVVPGASLAAGQPVGLVGDTGHAEGPHLHLQLDPATGYPQDEPWFQSFAGTAFSWLDSVQTNAAPNPVFAVVGDPQSQSRSLDSASTSGRVVYFTASGG